MTTEWGVFTDEGCVESQFYDIEAAARVAQAINDEAGEEDYAHAGVMCSECDNDRCECEFGSCECDGEPGCPDCGGTGEVLVEFVFGAQMQDCSCTFEEDDQ